MSLGCESVLHGVDFYCEIIWRWIVLFMRSCHRRLVGDDF